MSEFLKVNELLTKIKELKTDFYFKSRLQITDQIISTTKQGKPYLIFSMRDNTKEIRNVRKWINESEKLDHLCDFYDIGSIFEIGGKFDKKYNSISINSAKKLSSNEFSLKDYVKLPDINVEDLNKCLFETISEIHNEKLKELLNKIFDDNDISTKFFECPSSIKIHHPYKYGNLEHTNGMLTIFKNFEAFYKRNTLFDVDLIYTGIILHDIGKIHEYSIYNGLPISNKEYSLLGHHILGDQLVLKKIKEIDDFPKDLENRIRHIILSHHGKKEWGSPIEPQFPEAEIIHYLDMIDSRFKSTLK